MNRSCGLFVAEMLNLPIEIIENGKQKGKELEKFKDQYDEDIKANEDNDIYEINNTTLDKGMTNHQKCKALSNYSTLLRIIKMEIQNRR